MRGLLGLVSILFAAVLTFAQNQSGSAVPPYKNSSLPVEQRVQDLRRATSTSEARSILHSEPGCQELRWIDSRNWDCDSNELSHS